MKTKDIAYSGILAALAIGISALEGLLTLPFMPPGCKPGLSNVITLSAFLAVGAPAAFFVALLKALFALATRGVSAFLLSLAGGMLSCLVSVLLLKWKKCPFSYWGIGIAGALCHNGAQLAVACLLTGTGALVGYAPVLLIASLITGSVTGLILRILKPYLQKRRKKE